MNRINTIIILTLIQPRQPRAILHAKVATAAAHDKVQTADLFVLLQLGIHWEAHSADHTVIPFPAVDVTVQDVHLEMTDAVADALKRPGTVGTPKAAVLAELTTIGTSLRKLLPDQASLAHQVALSTVDAYQILRSCRK